MPRQLPAVLLTTLVLVSGIIIGGCDRKEPSASATGSAEQATAERTEADPTPSAPPEPADPKARLKYLETLKQNLADTQAEIDAAVKTTQIESAKQIEFMVKGRIIDRQADAILLSGSAMASSGDTSVPGTATDEGNLILVRHPDVRFVFIENTDKQANIEDYKKIHLFYDMDHEYFIGKQSGNGKSILVFGPPSGALGEAEARFTKAQSRELKAEIALRNASMSIDDDGNLIDDQRDLPAGATPATKLKWLQKRLASAVAARDSAQKAERAVLAKHPQFTVWGKVVDRRSDSVLIHGAAGPVSENMSDLGSVAKNGNLLIKAVDQEGFGEDDYSDMSGHLFFLGPSTDKDKQGKAIEVFVYGPPPVELVTLDKNRKDAEVRAAEAEKAVVAATAATSPSKNCQ